MSDPVDKALEPIESDLVDTTATVTDSDNSQSSTGAPPDITQIGSSFDDESEAYCSDPPDLNPEDEELDGLDRLPKTVSVTDTLEITDSNGPPDLTHSDDFEYGSNQEVLGLEESDFPDVIEAEACNPDSESVDIESDAFLTANSPQDSSPFISESGNNISLAQEVSKSLQLNKYSDTRYSESLLAVAPDDILSVRPGDILPVQQGSPNISSLSVHQVPVKRGPGRPRKDGLEAQPRKKTKVKSSIKVSHNIMASQHSMGHFAPMESLDSNSQGSSSLGEITSDIPMDAAFGMSEEESNSMYQLDDPVQDIPLRMCSLCNLAERSLLGQGDISRYEPTPDFNPFKQNLLKQEKKFSPDPDEKEGEKGPKPLTWRRNRGPMKGTKERSKSPRRYPHNWEDDDCFFGNELNFIGFEDVDIGQLFEPSGHVWAHHFCAAWSEGVQQSCNLLLLYVDKAVFAGISQKCNYCHKLGGTVKCTMQDCDNVYHYPCAAARGCFQDIKTLTLLCPDHYHQAQAVAGEDALCVICETIGNVPDQLFCTSCGHHYHSNCLNPVVSLTPEVRAGWQCPDCKVCQKCRKAGDDNKMLVCDTCDKGYHTYCLKPVMTTIPKNGWKCKNCRVCTDCESRTPGSGPSSRWHHNYSVCDSCYQQRNKGLFCPVCRKAYRQFTSNAMLQCSSCKKHVHRGCDESIELYMDPGLRDQQPEYVCITCKNGPEMDIDMASYPFPGLPADESNEEFFKTSADEFMMKDSEYDMSSMGDNSSQLDSNFFLNEDSVSSMDIDINVLEKGAQQLGQPHPEHSTGGKGGKLSVMSRKKLAVGKTRGRPPMAEKKKRTSSFSERKRVAKPKLKTSLSSSGSIGNTTPTTEVKVKDEEDDDDHPQTLIMADAEDQFVLNQDVCKSCGSFGKGEEGKLIVCTQCGQCYHPYCVSVKVTKVVLQKGWRCLDCTVCEGCGKPHDEGRLLLCDECDISYHIYCLEPPLEHVPKGTWKCKWCVKCVFCGTTSPGFGCQWQNNYTQCGPCNSKLSCPICRRSYCEEELIIQCLACDRWLHATCDGLRNEDETERAADFGYNCKFCRPRTGHPGPLPPPPPPSPPTPEEVRSPTPPLLPMFQPSREPEIGKRFHMDGVYLNQTGLTIIQNLMAQVPKIKRSRIKKKEQEALKAAQMEGSFKAPSIARMLSTQSSIDGEEEFDELRMSIDSESTTYGDIDDTLLSPTGLPNAPLLPGEQVVKEKKRTRRNIGLGVGGFIARHRTRAPNKNKQQEQAEGEEGEDGLDRAPGEAEQKQRRKRQTKKKSQLENSFPSYLQEAFFGKEILDKSKIDAKQGLKIDPMSEEEQEVPLSPSMLPGIGEPTSALLHDIDQTLKHSQMLPPVSVPKDKTADDDSISNLDEENFKDILPDDLSELAPDDALFNIIVPELTKDDDGTDEAKSELPNMEGMLSPTNLDVEKMLSEGLAHMDGQTVEDIFKGVLQDGQEGPLKPPADAGNLPEGVAGAQIPGQGQFPGPLPQFAMGAFPPGFGGKPGHPGFQGARFSSEFSEQGNWTANGDADDDDNDSGNSRRKILKWECDEELGSNATISAILYCNMNHPELRSQFPEWNERVKRIAKLWRSLSSEEKQPYLLQARKNRQNTKVTKVSNAMQKQLKKEKAAAEAAAAAMRPPMPPGLPPFPQSGEGSPLQDIRSPLNRTPSNPQAAEGSSPGTQIPPGSVPSSPIHRGYAGPQTDPLQRLQHVGPDPYAQPVPTPRPMDPRPPMDPYAHPPQTPRSHAEFAVSRPQTLSSGDPFSASATDPFEQSPSAPRSVGPPGTPQQSPSQPHWPGAAQESDPFAQSPVKQMPEGMQSPSPKMPEGFPQQMVRPGLPGMTRPPFVRQASQGDPYATMPPTPTTSQPEDPYAFQPSTPRPVGESYRMQGPRGMMPRGQMIRQPITSMPQVSGGEMRPPFLQRSMSTPGMQMPPGSENFMQRPPFRPPVSQQMVRPGNFDPYSQPPHPGMDPSREPSVGQDKGAQGDQKQQLREILAQKSKNRQKRKEQWPEGTQGPPGSYPGDERFPVPQVPGMPPQGMERWPGPPMMGPPPQHMQMRPEMQARMRGPFPEGMRPGVPMRQPRPGGPMPGQEGFPGNRPMRPQQPGQQPTPEQIAMYHQRMQQQQQQQQQMAHGPPPPGYGPQGVPLHPGQRPRMPFDPNKEQVPSSVGGLPGSEGQVKVLQPGMAPGAQLGQAAGVPKTEKAKLPLEEKGEDNIDDFLDLDGSFDILKYADPDLDDFNLEGKTIFDDLEDEPVPDGTSTDKAKPKEKAEENKGEKTPSGSKSDNNYQTKFLEFSQKKGEQASTDDEKSKQEINQIAALLQKSEQLSQKLERRDSQKSDGSGKDNTNPNTPSGVMEPIGNLGAQGMARFQPGIHSPLHPSLQGSAVPSPGSAGGGYQQGPGTPGLVSPKIMPSPRSSAPSPKTPNALSPFSQQPVTPSVSGQQIQSPFSQPTNSPFSPSISCSQSPFSGTVSTSAPVSPYGAPVSQPPFGLPPGSLQATYGSQSSPMAASQSPGQRSPRGAMTPTSQYIQGNFGKPGQPMPAGMMYGQRAPFPGPPGSEGYHPEVDPNLQGVQAGVRPNVPSSASFQEGMARFPGQGPPMRGPPPGFPGQFPPRMRQPAPGMTSPGVTTPTSAPNTTRPQLLQDQPLLIQDLLEKEKQEQQRQAQQQAMMHRREGSVEGMMGAGPQPMAPYRPRMLEQSNIQRHPMDPNWIGQRMYSSQPPEGQPPFHVRMPGPGQGPRLPTPGPPFTGPGIGPQGIPPPPQPPIPPMQGENSAENERQHVQYEDWLMKHSQYLEMQIKALETQIAKCKRTKKAINARNRQAKKIGKELPPNDQIELERTTQEQTMLQKQLEGMRKQLRHHQMITQDYRAKRREKFGDPSMNVPPADGQPPQPRIPAGGSTRLPQSARQEYDAYMMNKLRQQQQMAAGPPGPRPPIQIVGDNNPFSESYQEREKLEKHHVDPVIPGVIPSEAGDVPPERPPFFGPVGFEQGIRLPATSGDQQRYHLQGPPRFADPSMMGGEPAVRPPMPGFPGPDQARMGFRPGAPSGPSGPPFSQGTAPPAPLEPRPPIHFTPQSETDKRIMEILESTAGQFRRQQEGKADDQKEPTSKPGTPGKSPGQKEAKTDSQSSDANTSTTATTMESVTKSDQQPTPTTDSKAPSHPPANLNLPSNAELSRESEDSQDSEPILPMNVMIHQQSMPARVSIPQLVTSSQSAPGGKTENQQQQMQDTQQVDENVRPKSSSPRVAPGSNSPRIPTPHSVEAARSTSGSPRIPPETSRSTSGSPRIPQSPSQWLQSEINRPGSAHRSGDGYKSGSSSPRISESPSQRSTASPRVPNAPSPKDIQRAMSSPRSAGGPPMDPHRPGSANSDTCGSGSQPAGSPRVPPSHSPASAHQYSVDPQGLPPGQQAHFLARAGHAMAPRGRPPGQASPRQSQPSPISESQMMAQSQMPPSQFAGRKSPGQGMPPHSMGRGMPPYPPSNMPPNFQGMGMPPRQGMMLNQQNRFQNQPGFHQNRPMQFDPGQQRPLSQRYMYPYPQSVTSSLAESTLAQLPRFTAKVTTPATSTDHLPTPISTGSKPSTMQQAPRPAMHHPQMYDASLQGLRHEPPFSHTGPTSSGSNFDHTSPSMVMQSAPHSMPHQMTHSLQGMQQAVQNIPHSLQNVPHSLQNIGHSMQATHISQPASTQGNQSGVSNATTTVPSSSGNFLSSAQSSGSNVPQQTQSSDSGHSGKEAFLATSVASESTPTSSQDSMSSNQNTVSQEPSEASS